MRLTLENKKAVRTEGSSHSLIILAPHRGRVSNSLVAEPGIFLIVLDNTKIRLTNCPTNGNVSV